MTSDYLTGLPEPDEIRNSLQFAYDYWQNRNKFITDARQYLSGLNAIQAPKDTPYKIRTMHTYMLASVINEKAARFMQMPTIQAIPVDESDEARRKSSELELAINSAMFEMERRSDGDVWSRAVLDAIFLDEGVERVERAPAAFWPETITKVDTEPTLVFEDELRDAIKKEYGIPLRTVYVPLENFFPIYEGPNLVESFEVELRSLRSVLRNPLFDKASMALQGYSANTATTEGLRTEVSIVHYVNSKYHAYYAMLPVGTANMDGAYNWPNLTGIGLTALGNPVLLHAYEHNLGQSMYNCIAGRFGGWKSSTNRIEGVGKGLLELNQAADEIASQVFTNVRAKYWPSLLQKVDPDQRGYQPGGSEPKALVVPEGQNLVIFKDEEIEPLFKPVDDPIVPWIWDKIVEQISRLGGSPVVFGGRQPGVETGYHQSLQITQSEHLDEKIEQHLSFGAINRATIMLKHIKAMDLGKVYAHAVEQGKGGRTYSAYHSIDPNDLRPLPRLDAQVRKPRPVDFAASIRAAREASDERQGKGPLLSDDSIRQDLLSIQAPDIEAHKILVETQKRKLLASGVLDQEIAQKLNLLLVAQSTPTPAAGGNVPPALQGAAQQLTQQQQATQQQTQQAVQQPSVTASGTPLPTGMPAGQSQPEQAAGQELFSAMQGNR